MQLILLILASCFCSNLLALEAQGENPTIVYTVEPRKNPVIQQLEENLVSKEARMSGPVVRKVLETLEKLYSILNTSDNMYGSRINELRNLLAKSQFPNDSDCTLEALDEIDKMISKNFAAMSKKFTKQNGFNENNNNNNINNYLRFYLINKGLKCNYDFELEVERVKTINLIEPQLLIQLRDFVANSNDCHSETNKVPLLYYEINELTIPPSCLVSGFAELLSTLDVYIGANRISSKKIRAQIDQILAKLKIAGEQIENLRAEYIELISLVPELIDFTGHQTIGLLEASLIADEQHIRMIQDLRNEIIKRIKQKSGNFFEKIFN